MLKAEYIVYLRIYVNVSCFCKNSTTNHLNNDQQSLGFTLMLQTRIRY